MAFGLAALFFMAVHAVYDISFFLHDAAEYWRQAGSISAGGRGYLLPFLLAPARRFASDAAALSAYRWMSSVVYAAILTVVMPRCFVGIFGGKLTVLRRLVPCILMVTVFPGLLVYPMSDLPALFFSLGSVAVLAGWHDGRHRGWKPLLLAGALAGAAYNTRSIYLFAFAVLALAVLLASRGGWARRAGFLAALCAGFLLVNLPQLAINKHFHRIYSIAPTPGKDLFAFQLFAGLEVQRYETTTEPDGRRAGVPYMDREGVRIVKESGFGPQERTFANYLSVLGEFPFDVLGIYGRHLINGLDVRDGRIYIVQRASTRDGASLYGFTLLALAVWVLCTGAARRRLADHQAGASRPAWWLGALMLPVAAIMPGAVETRYFVALHFLAYCVIAFHAEPRLLAADLRRNFLPVALVFAIALCIFAAVSQATVGV